MKAHANFQKYGKGEADNGCKLEVNGDKKEKEVKLSNIFGFYQEDTCVLNIQCCFIKDGLLDPTAVSMPKDARHAGEVVSSAYDKYVKKPDQNSIKIQEPLSAPIKSEKTMKSAKKDEALKPLNRQKYESERFQRPT